MDQSTVWKTRNVLIQSMKGVFIKWHCILCTFLQVQPIEATAVHRHFLHRLVRSIDKLRRPKSVSFAVDRDAFGPMDDVDRHVATLCKVNRRLHQLFASYQSHNRSTTRRHVKWWHWNHFEELHNSLANHCRPTAERQSLCSKGIVCSSVHWTKQQRFSVRYFYWPLLN